VKIVSANHVDQSQEVSFKLNIEKTDNFCKMEEDAKMMEKQEVKMNENNLDEVQRV